jgi:hypothetical protein
MNIEGAAVPASSHRSHQSVEESSTMLGNPSSNNHGTIRRLSAPGSIHLRARDISGMLSVSGAEYQRIPSTTLRYDIRHN